MFVGYQAALKIRNEHEKQGLVDHRRRSLSYRRISGFELSHSFLFPDRAAARGLCPGEWRHLPINCYFGKDVAPRWLNAVFALVRIVAGLALLYCIPSGLRVLTLVFAVFLMVDGAFGILGAFKIRAQKGWIVLLLNGVITLVLGLMVYAHWPTGSVWLLGFFFGISLLCHGFALLRLGLTASKTVG